MKIYQCQPQRHTILISQAKYKSSDAFQSQTSKLAWYHISVKSIDLTLTSTKRDLPQDVLKQIPEAPGHSWRVHRHPASPQP